MNKFLTVFEIVGGGEGVGLEFGIVAIFIGIILLILRLLKRIKVRFSIPLFCIVLGLGWLSFSSAFLETNENNKQLNYIYLKKQYEIIEGNVNVLRTQPKGGHAPGDLIEIDGKQFEINYYIRTDAYKNTIANGGCLTENTYARVYHYKGQILRVDVKNKL